MKNDQFNRRNSLDAAQSLRIDGNTPLNLPRLNSIIAPTDIGNLPLRSPRVNFPINVSEFGDIPLRSPRVNFPLPSKLILKIIFLTQNTIRGVHPGANVTNNRIGNDLTLAQNLWRIDLYRTITAVPNPGIVASQITTNPLNSVALSLEDNYSEPGVITVIYVPGFAMIGPIDQSTGLPKPVVGTSFAKIYDSGQLGGTIILADGGSSPLNTSLFPHELGHLLFTRIVNGEDFSVNPPPNDPKDEAHSSDPLNLMYFAPGNNIALRPAQIQKASESPLLVVITPP